MNISPVNAFTNTNNHKRANTLQNNQHKPVTFGYGDYGTEPTDPHYDGGGSGGFWNVLKGSIIIITLPISLPIILIRDKMSRDKEDSYFKEVLDPPKPDNKNKK